jgi:hypothetical protein
VLFPDVSERLKNLAMVYLLTDLHNLEKELIEIPLVISPRSIWIYQNGSVIPHVTELLDLNLEVKYLLPVRIPIFVPTYGTPPTQKPPRPTFQSDRLEALEVCSYVLLWFRIPCKQNRKK